MCGAHGMVASKRISSHERARHERIVVAVAERYSRSIRAGKTHWSQPSLERSYGSRSPFGHGTSFWVVEKPVKVWLPTGRLKPSNVWIGASNRLSTEVEEVTLKPGDELHQIPGGLFAAWGNTAVYVWLDEVDIPRSSVREIQRGRDVQYRQALGPQKMLREEKPASPEGKVLRQYVEIGKEAGRLAVEFEKSRENQPKMTAVLTKLKKLLEHVPDAPQLPPNQRRQDEAVMDWLMAREDAFVTAAAALHGRAWDNMTNHILEELRALEKATQKLESTL